MSMTQRYAGMLLRNADEWDKRGMPVQAECLRQAANHMYDMLDEIARLERAVSFISVADTCGELCPVGSTDTEYDETGNNAAGYVGPWRFLRGTGDTFLEAVEDEMAHASGVRK